MECIACKGSMELWPGEPCPLCDGIGNFFDENEGEPHEETQVPALSVKEPDFTWNINASQIRFATAQRQPLQSPTFKLEGSPSKFVIMFYPCTNRGPNKTNTCSLFLYTVAEAKVRLQVQVRVNATARLIDPASAVEVDERGRGYRNFCAPVEGDTIVQLHVLQMGDDRKVEWALPPRYEMRKFLGAGGYGSVQQAWDTKENRYVAVKQLLGVFGSTETAKKLLREIGILSALHHSHIVQIFGAFIDKRSGMEALYIVMEQCDMDLYAVCTASRGVSLPEARRLAYNVVLGCQYLHSKRVYHRDLKPGNILVNRDCSVKICDFNLARTVEAKTMQLANHDELSVPKIASLSRELTLRVCTPMYRPPEVLLCLKYSEAIDVWAVGCIFFELFGALNTSGRQPRHRMLFEGRKSWPLSGSAHAPGDLLEQIIDVLGTPFDDPLFAQLPLLTQNQLSTFQEKAYKGLRGSVPVEAEETGLALVEELLRFFPEYRISMDEALTHNFFRRVRRNADDLSSDMPCCLEVTYDESNLGKLEDVQEQIEAEIAKFDDGN